MTTAADLPPWPDNVHGTWHLRRPGELADGAGGRLVGIDAFGAWEVSTARGGGIRVAVVDTGIDLGHPSLAANIDRGAARDFDHGPGERGRSLPEGGRIDNPIDAHGTACAGIVAAIAADDPRVADGTVRLPPGGGVAGVAPRATIVPVRISTIFDTDVLVGALRHAEATSDVILLARYVAPRPELATEIERIARGKPVICASGNNGTSRLIHPADLPATIAVGACNEKGWRSTYSQHGRGLDVVAPSNDAAVEDRDAVRLDAEEVDRRRREKADRDRPAAAVPAAAGDEVPEPELRAALAKVAAEQGWNLERMGELAIATTDQRGEYGYNDDPAGAYCKATGRFGFGGTSAAAAQVAGVVALMLAAAPALKGQPGLVRRILRETASLRYLRADSPVGQPPHAEFGYGLVDARAAVGAALEAARAG